MALQQGPAQLPATDMQVAFGESLASGPALQHCPVPGTLKTGGSWNIETVDSSSGSVSIALDSSNNPHIAYGENSLKYAYYNGSSWSIETVDSVSSGTVYNSLTLDSSNNPHIAYGNTTLKYAVKSGESWNIKMKESNRNNIPRF